MYIIQDVNIVKQSGRDDNDICDNLSDENINESKIIQFDDELKEDPLINDNGDIWQHLVAFTAIWWHWLTFDDIG